ncbi:MAG TPA: aminotransferase class III-fold pyridoxal phosphate-dependent enzyme, partial [Polyangiaceae bacterium]|nr:aminotransferase class III-fold pyridoxal phosphate-dependent enzyme [Polyangiaceae bacterium]
SPDVVRSALLAQVDQVMNVGPAHFSEPALELSRRLSGFSGLDKIFFGNSGAEANEAAVKLCRKWGQKRRSGAFEVITTVDGFHGRTLAMTCATGKSGWDEAFPPRVEGFKKVAYGSVDAVASAISERTVAVMVEPIQGEAGAVVPPESYLRELRALCSERGVLLVLDEIQTGLCRTGPLFAFQAAGIRPDMVTLGKGLGGGVPISALLARADVACFDDGDHGSTFGGNALCCAVAIAVLDELTSESGRIRREASSRYLAEALQRIAAAFRARLRGRGHLFGLVLPDERAVALRDACFERGLLVNAARPNVLRFMPSLCVSPEEIDQMSETLLALR